MFDQRVFKFSIREDETSDFTQPVIGRVTATDPEGDGVSYSLSSSGDEALVIAISNGNVLYTGGFRDHSESDYSYSYTVRVQDEHGAWGVDATIEVEVVPSETNPAGLSGSALVTDTPPAATSDTLLPQDPGGPFPPPGAGYTATPELGDAPTAPDFGMG